MIRIIVKKQDAYLAANTGCDVVKEFLTFDVIAPEVEELLKASDRLIRYEVIGVEVVD